MKCKFCLNHEQGDTLYESSDWDGGICFDYIRDIKYCPLCGRKLHLETEPNCSEKLNNCETCRFELYCPEMCEGCCEWDSHYEPKDEAQTDAYDSAKFSHNCIGMCENPKMYMAKVTDEPQMKQQIKRPWGMYIIEHPMYE